MRFSLAIALAVVLSATVALAGAPDKGKAGRPPAPRAKVTHPHKAAPPARHVAPPKTTNGNPARHTTRTAHAPATALAPTTATAPALPRNPKLVARLQTLLPPGTDVNAAALGFRNQGAFVSAVHVSRNLGIEFPALKAKIVGEGLSLGQAIQSLRGGVDATAAVRRAELQAADDLNARSTKKTRQRP